MRVFPLPQEAERGEVRRVVGYQSRPCVHSVQQRCDVRIPAEDLRVRPDQVIVDVRQDLVDVESPDAGHHRLDVRIRERLVQVRCPGLHR